MRRFPMLIIAMLLIAGSAIPASARSFGLQGLGPRVGVSFTPNQFFFGGHADFGDLFPNTALLLPVVELGLGDNVTLLSVGSDLLYRVPEEFGGWRPYAGGELAFLVAGSDGGDSTDLGLSGVLGMERILGGGDRFAAELKFEIIDAPNIKLGLLWTFSR